MTSDRNRCLSDIPCNPHSWTHGPTTRRLYERSDLSRTRIRHPPSEPAGDRTQDLRIKSPLLYQLSYRLAGKVTPRADRRDPSGGKGAGRLER